MVHNLYDLERMVADRARETERLAQRSRLVPRVPRRTREARRPLAGHPLKARLGLQLIRLGVWVAG